MVTIIKRTNECNLSILGLSVWAGSFNSLQQEDPLPCSACSAGAPGRNCGWRAASCRIGCRGGTAEGAGKCLQGSSITCYPQSSAAAPHHTSDLLWRPTSQVSTGAWSLALLLSLQWSEEVLGKSNEKQRTGSCWRPAEQSSWLRLSP